MVDFTELCSTNYRRLELKSSGPLSIWLHYFQGFQRGSLETKIKISTCELQRTFLTIIYKTVLHIQVPLPIYVPANVRIFIDANNVILHAPNGTKIHGVPCIPSASVSEEVKSVDVDSVVVVRCADVKIFNDYIQFFPADYAIIIAEGGTNHVITNQNETTKIIGCDE